jgi:hypothetical protein
MPIIADNDNSFRYFPTGYANGIIGVSIRLSTDIKVMYTLIIKYSKDSYVNNKRKI